MKTTLPFHIVSTLSGEQDAQFMIIQINENAVEAILESRRMLSGFNALHSAWQRLEHFEINIILLSDFPEGHGLGLELDTDAHIILADGPLCIPVELDEAFLEAARVAGFLLASECERIQIDTLGRLHAAAYEKHCDVLLLSHDLAPLIDPILYPLRSAPCLNSDKLSTAPSDPEADLPTFTAWCQQANGCGTIHIASFEAADLNAAIEQGIHTCMEDWEEENPANIHLLGIAKGDIQILHWNDIDGGDM